MVVVLAVVAVQAGKVYLKGIPINTISGINALSGLGIIVLVALASAGALALLVHRSFGAPRVTESVDPGQRGLKFRQAWIPGPGGKRLFAWLLPAEQATGTMVMIHGWGGNAEFMLPLAEPFQAAGMNVLLIDARNHGRSDGGGHSSLPRFAADVGCAVDWVREQTEFAGPVALFGHSLGAGAVLLAAADRGDIDAVISLASFAHPAAMMRRFMSRRRLPTILVPAILRYVEWLIGRRFADIAPINTVCRLTCPVLLVHGSDDRTVPEADLAAMREKCAGHPPEFLLIPGAGHTSVSRFLTHQEDFLAFLRGAGLDLRAATGRTT